MKDSGRYPEWTPATTQAPNRRSFLLGAGGLAAVGLTAVACGSPAPSSSGGAGNNAAAASLPIRVAGYSAPAITTMWTQAMQQFGYFTANGLDASVTNTTNSNVMPLLLGNKVDVTLGTVNLVQLAAQGQSVVAFAGVGNYQPYWLLSNKSIASLSDLRGKTIATADQSTSTVYVLMVQLLKNQNMTPGDVRWFDLQQGTQRTDALISGRADASLVSADQAIIILNDPQAKNLHVLSSSPVSASFWRPYEEWITTSQYINQHGEELQRFTKAMIQVNRRLSSDKNAFVQAATENVPGETSDSAAKAYAALQPWWSVNGGIDPSWIAGVERISDSLFNLKPVTVSSLYTTKFVASALDELGVVKSKYDPADWYHK
jgi:ABC-type nitrate/sulfonate/bicarbonate transport system substrate-binding protein